MNRKLSTLEDLLHKLEKEPEFQEEQRRQAPYYDLLLEVVKRRKQLGLTQEELAERAGTHQSSISRVETGEYDIRLSTLIDIAEALEARVKLWLVPYSTQEDEQGYRKLFEVSSSLQTETQSYTASPTRSHEVTRI